MQIIVLLFLMALPAWAHEAYFFSVPGHRAEIADARWLFHTRPGQRSLLIYDGLDQITLVYPGEGEFALGHGTTVRLKSVGRLCDGTIAIHDDGYNLSVKISGQTASGEAVECQIWMSKSGAP